MIERYLDEFDYQVHLFAGVFGIFGGFIEVTIEVMVLFSFLIVVLIILFVEILKITRRAKDTTPKRIN